MPEFVGIQTKVVLAPYGMTFDAGGCLLISNSPHSKFSYYTNFSSYQNQNLLLKKTSFKKYISYRDITNEQICWWIYVSCYILGAVLYE
jgi:hypothetical protein